jgi:hypothetical protein
MPCLSKNSFSIPPQLKTSRHILPEYGADAFVNVRELTAQELLALQNEYGTKASGLDFAFAVLSLVLVDDENKQIFASADECKANLQLSLKGIDALLATALEVSGVKTDKVDEPKN